MDIIYKTLVGIFSAVILMAGGFAVSVYISDDISVNNYFEAVTQTIVESDYNETVIENCIQEAGNMGYKLTVAVHGADVYGVKRYADIRMSYTSRIALFGVSAEKTRQKVL